MREALLDLRGLFSDALVQELHCKQVTHAFIFPGSIFKYKAKHYWGWERSQHREEVYHVHRSLIAPAVAAERFVQYSLDFSPQAVLHVHIHPCWSTMWCLKTEIFHLSCLINSVKCDSLDGKVVAAANTQTSSPMPKWQRWEMRRSRGQI